MKVNNLKSNKFKNVQMLDSDLITYYEFDDIEHKRGTLFIDRMKIEKMDLEGGVITINFKVAKGKGFDSS